MLVQKRTYGFLKGLHEVSDPFDDGQSALLLAQAIVDTVREPLLVLDNELRIVAASRSFYTVFRVHRGNVLGRSIYNIVEDQLDIPSLRPLLEKIAPEHGVMEGFEAKVSVGNIGSRTLLLNARKVFYADNGHSSVLLAFEDVTERRNIEIEKSALLKRAEELLEQKDLLLQEMQHRVANSLQIIASILMLKARTVTSEETRLHLHDAHQRVMSVATIQQHIQSAGRADLIEINPYLTKLCESLAASMIGDAGTTSVKVNAGGGYAPSADAVSIGLIVMELVINALKHAFVKDRMGACVTVSYETSGSDWRLTVSDNGDGRSAEASQQPKGGLGTSLVGALANQLDAQVKTASTPGGMTITITKATFDSQLPKAA